MIVVEQHLSNGPSTRSSVSTGRTAEGNDWICQQFLPRNPVRVIVLKQQPWEGIFFSVCAKGKRMTASSMAGEKLGVILEIYNEMIMLALLWSSVTTGTKHREKRPGGHESYLAA